MNKNYKLLIIIVLLLVLIALGILIYNYKIPKIEITIPLPEVEEPSEIKTPNGTITLPPTQAELPSSVANMRTALYIASQQESYDELSKLIDVESFSYTFGLDEARDPIAYWQTYGPDNIFEIISTLLELPYGVTQAGENTYYSWPMITTLSPEEWTDEMLDAVSSFVTPEQIEDYQKFGGYIGWRLSINQDGTWTSFIAGD